MIDTLEGALDADSLRNTHPVSTRVNDPVQISEIVDVISYHKVKPLDCKERRTRDGSGMGRGRRWRSDILCYK